MNVYKWTTSYFRINRNNLFIRGCRTYTTEHGWNYDKDKKRKTK